MLTVDELNKLGANTEEGLKRCMGREDMYLKLVPKALNDANFERLKDAISNNDLTLAFEAVHAIKGVSGNLSLTPIYDKSDEITELLRKKSEADYSLLVDELIEIRDKFRACCE
ncbi:MAG: Hpt domain-containing protein [Lachnospiraceae bacterium]|nr:Hpt domain-containing protein [Lachnospiraceae bacterium]